MSDLALRCDLPVAPDHPAFVGHFPGEPILPGVVLLAEILEAARAEPGLAALIGAEPRLAISKFLGAVRPGAALTIAFRIGASGLDWSVDDAGRAVASGRIVRTDSMGVPGGVRGGDTEAARR